MASPAVSPRGVATAVAGYARLASNGVARPEEAGVTTTLDEVADAADEVADQQRYVARRARAMQRRRDAGASWTSVLDAERGPFVLDVLRRSAQRLTSLTGQLARVLARGLSTEGQSRRRIAARLGVSHQRVSALVGNGSTTRRVGDSTGE